MLDTCEGFPTEPVAMLCCIPSSCQLYNEGQLKDKHILQANETLDALACFSRHPNRPQQKDTDDVVVVPVVVLSVSVVSLLGLTLAVLAIHRWQQQKVIGKQMEMEQQVRVGAFGGVVTLEKAGIFGLVGAMLRVCLGPDEQRPDCVASG